MEMTGIEITVDSQGKLTVPASIIKEMQLVPGDTVRITCISKLPDGPLYLLDESQEEAGEISLPNELLEAANIPKGSDLDIVCTEGAIVIMAADLLDRIPDELCELFYELGIDPDVVRSVIREGGIVGGQ